MKNYYFCACAEDGGIYRYDENFNFIDVLPLDKPMYMVTENKKAYILLKDGFMVVCDISDTGALENVSEPVSTHGKVPCHLCVQGGQAYVVNYLSGNLVKMPDAVVTHHGCGPHPTRQEAAHTHFVCVHEDKVYCVDLGTDSIHTYSKDLVPISIAHVPSSSGCRHLAFYRGLVFCVNELSSDVSVFENNDGLLTYLDTYSCNIDSKDNTAAAIRVHDGRLYVSHRGADCITEFEISGKTLVFVKNTDCGGNGPRDFDIIDGKTVCTNEKSNDVTVIGTDIRLQMPSPICICTEDI